MVRRVPCLGLHCGGGGDLCAGQLCANMGTCMKTEAPVGTGHLRAGGTCLQGKAPMYQGRVQLCPPHLCLEPSSVHIALVC